MDHGHDLNTYIHDAVHSSISNACNQCCPAWSYIITVWWPHVLLLKILQWLPSQNAQDFLLRCFRWSTNIHSQNLQRLHAQGFSLMLLSSERMIIWEIHKHIPSLNKVWIICFYRIFNTKKKVDDSSEIFFFFERKKKCGGCKGALAK